jgi:two-component system cell cycle sensor histidine kinase/response regulator CckA
VIIGYAEDLEENLEPSGRLHKEAEEVRKAGERAASLTRQLLAFSRHHELQRRVLDLNQVIGDLAKMLRRLIGSDIEFSVQLDPLAGRIKADQGQMEQVIMNLVVNARDAMPEGGRLLVSTRNIRLAAADLAKIPQAAPGDYTELTVTDTGIGMDAGTLMHIFEPFFTTKEEGKGTGLGLATVAGIVKQCGGQIFAASEPGKGSTFRVLVPQTREALPSPAMKHRTLTATSVEHTVLLAEDDGALRELISDVLSRNGYRVLEAATPGAALRVLREFSAPIDLLLSDIVLPGMKGPELAAAVASIRPEIRVLYMSGYSETDPKTRQYLPTSAPFLCKPFTTETLLLAVSEAISPSIPESV